MRVLAVSEVVEEGLLADLGPVRGSGLIFACGDLPFDYLDYVMNALGPGRCLLDIGPGTGVRLRS